MAGPDPVRGGCLGARALRGGGGDGRIQRACLQPRGDRRPIPVPVPSRMDPMPAHESSAPPNAKRAARGRAKAAAGFPSFEVTRASQQALRLAAAQVDNVEATAKHLTKVFADERVHARV